MSVLAILPARYGSTRFPGKPLAPIGGKPMIQHVWERTRAAKSVDAVVIATDDERIRDACDAFGAEVEMTRDDHPTGTDRLAEVAEAMRMLDIAATAPDGELRGQALVQRGTVERTLGRTRESATDLQRGGELLGGDTGRKALLRAAEAYKQLGLEADARRCIDAADRLDGDRSPGSPGTTAIAGYTLQFGAFESRANAEAQLCRKRPKKSFCGQAVAQNATLLAPWRRAPPVDHRLWENRHVDNAKIRCVASSVCRSAGGDGRRLQPGGHRSLSLKGVYSRADCDALW